MIEVTAVYSSRKSINTFAEYGRAKIIWVTGSHIATGNKKTKKCQGRPNKKLENPKLFDTITSELKNWTLNAHILLWTMEAVSKTTNKLLEIPNWDKTNSPPKLWKKKS